MWRKPCNSQEKKIFLGNKIMTPASACTVDLFLSLLNLSEEKPQESDWQTTAMEPKFISTTSWPIWEIKHGGILSQWNHCKPPTLFPCTAGESQCKRWKEKEERLYDGLFGVVGARLVGRLRTQRASERALVIWSVRQLGLSSETQWGEVGDHVWGPPSCYCP